MEKNENLISPGEKPMQKCIDFSCKIGNTNYEVSSSIAAEYALGGLSNNIFASRYVSYIPNKEELIAQVEAVLKEWNNKTEYA